ncbi:MAG: TerB family tellurite resistance protein [Proteobacteria bacterium]|nr:TerB family tellurite resistance protein [Pseudomonadota bacterium]
MSVPLQSLNKQQKYWYTRFVVAAILADNEISASEVDFIEYIMSIVDNPAHKRELMQLLKLKRKPILVKPVGIGPEILTAIFTELILIMISDLDFHDRERTFLKQVSNLFDFSDAFFSKLMEWGEEGLEWKNSRKQFVTGKDVGGDLHVPLQNLDAEQRKWYAQVLIATIMLDGIIEKEESQFLKMAASLLSNKEDQQQLLGYIRNKIAPPIIKPPAMPAEVLILIFIELMMIVSADEFLSVAELSHLRNISDMCGFTPAQYTKLIDWCNRGLLWKKSKNALIKQSHQQSDKLVLTTEQKFKPDPENNSLLSLDLTCFVCNSEKKVKIFKLKPDSHKTSNNIFGVTAFRESNTDCDFIDFNLFRVSICPSCYFASAEKKLFRKDADTSLPPELNHPQLVSYWLKKRPQLRMHFKERHWEFSSIQRTLPTVKRIYNLAIEILGLIGKVNQDESKQWSALVLSLYLAEILMSNGQRKKAEVQLLQTRKMANAQFGKTSNRMSTLSLKNAKVLFLIALYFREYEIAERYLNFFTQIADSQETNLKPQEQAFLRKMCGDVKLAYAKRDYYSPKGLKGFHQKH